MVLEEALLCDVYLCNLDAEYGILVSTATAEGFEGYFQVRQLMAFVLYFVGVSGLQTVQIFHYCFLSERDSWTFMA